MSLNVLKNKSFRNLFWAGSISELGSFVTDTALMLFLFEITNQEKQVLGISKFVFMAFLTLGSIMGGPLGEKFNRKKILILCEGLRLPLIVCIFFTQNPYLIILINGAIAFFTGVFNPSRQTMTNDFLKDQEIIEANNLFSISMAMIHLLGPILGATIYAQMGSINPILYADIISYLIALSLLIKIPLYKSSTSLKGEPYLKTIKEGFKYAKSRNDLSSILFNSCISGFSMGVLFPLILPFTKEQLGQSDQGYGVLMMVFGLGGIIGGFISTKINLKSVAGKFIYFSLMVELCVFICWNNNTSYFSANIILLIWGILVFIRLPLQLSYLSLTVDKSMLTRSHGLLDIAFVLPNILGTTIVALLADQISLLSLLNSAALFGFIIMVLRLPLASTRFLLKSRLK